VRDWLLRGLLVPVVGEVGQLRVMRRVIVAEAAVPVRPLVLVMEAVAQLGGVVGGSADGDGDLLPPPDCAPMVPRPRLLQAVP
jgi:hypothetical protein